MSKKIIKPGQIMRLVNKGKLAEHIAGGTYRCQKCNCRIEGDTESPTFHQNGSYVHCNACDAQVLYFADFPATPLFVDGFSIDVSGERKKYPVTFDED